VTRKPRVARPKRGAPRKGADAANAEHIDAAAIAEPVAEPIAPPISEIEASNLSLHELFAQQAAEMLERADLDEEQRQSVLLAMSCPCCGAGGPSFSFRLKRRT
jgi:hypothetical protein